MVNWKECGNPFMDFTEETTKKWIERGWNEERTKEWLNIGLKVTDADYAWWIKNIKKKNSEWVLNCGNEEELRKEYKEYLKNESNIRQLVKQKRNWQENNYPFKKFTEELTQEWVNHGFNKKETREWLESDLQPKDATFAQWLRDELKLNHEKFENHDEQELRKQYQDFLGGNQKKVIDKWKKARYDFTPELQQFLGMVGFDCEKLKKAIDSNSVSTNFYEYMDKILEIMGKLNKNINVEKELAELMKKAKEMKDEIIESIKEDKKIDYGLCKVCKSPNTGGLLQDPDSRSLSQQYFSHNDERKEYYDVWCRSCNAQHFAQDFGKWTSGNPEIDEFIQEVQLEANSDRQIVEWIPYEQFVNIEYLAKGGFGEVYKAVLPSGGIIGWDIRGNKWKRRGDDKTPIGNKVLVGQLVALKVLNNSQNMTAKFLQEVSHHKLCGDRTNIVQCYGISQEPKTKNYIMVMNYYEGGNLRQYLKNNQLNLRDKLFQLRFVARGLEEIHKRGLVHRDFHPGNILNRKHPYEGLFKGGSSDSLIFITDLGLCRPVNERNKDKVFGVLPYVAPEILISKYLQSKVFSWLQAL